MVKLGNHPTAYFFPLFWCFFPPPRLMLMMMGFDVASRLSPLRMDILFVSSVRVVGVLCLFFALILFCFAGGTYPRPFRWPPAWFIHVSIYLLSIYLCELVPSPLASLFYFVYLFCFYWWYVSSPSPIHLWPSASSLVPGGCRWWWPHPHLSCIFICAVLFSPRIACRGAEGSAIFLFF